jgi:hypothetical protein
MEDRQRVLQHITEHPDVKIVESDDGCRILLGGVKLETLEEIVSFVDGL